MPDLPILPAVADQPVSVVLLARSEESVDALLPVWTSYLDRLGRPWELLVAETAPRATADRMVSYLRNSRIALLRADGPPAEGLALRTALEQARHPLVYTARLAPGYPPSDLARFLLQPRARRPDTDAPCPEIDLVHLATGYRASRPVPPFWKGLGTVARIFQQILLSLRPSPLPGWLGLRTHLNGLLFRLLFGIRNRDIFCPCRLLRREIVPRLALQSEGMLVHAEILAKATFLGLILSEDIPVGEGQKGGSPTAAEVPAEASEIYRRDFRRLFWTPRFGPSPAASAT